jgi:hypothetical protein
VRFNFVEAPKPDDPTEIVLQQDPDGWWVLYWWRDRCWTTAGVAWTHVGARIMAWRCARRIKRGLEVERIRA